jgi:hypothetical protein
MLPVYRGVNVLDILEIVLPSLVGVSLFFQILAFFYFGIEWKWMKTVRGKLEIVEGNIRVLSTEISLTRTNINNCEKEIHSTRQFIRSQIDNSSKFLK